MEYIQREVKAINIGEPVIFTNKCSSPYMVGMGVVFHEDGDYLVSVYDNHITVQTTRKGK